jgi:hypothetical protein
LALMDFQLIDGHLTMTVPALAAACCTDIVKINQQIKMIVTRI